MILNKISLRRYSLLGGLTAALLFQYAVAFAQAQHYKQANNEFAFNSDLTKKWALEANIGQSWTSQPGKSHVFSNLSQLYGNAWVHYAPSPKWKLSAAYAYYYNEYVPDIDQRAAPEWRSSVQAIYYLDRRRTIINSRLRIEDRHIQNSDTVFEAVHRLRVQGKVVYPINSKIIGKKVFYGILSDEIYLKTKSKASGDELFDRNKVIAGLGYGITENLQIEVIYTNEFLPRPISKNYNAGQVNLIFNNFFRKLSQSIFGSQKE